MLSGRPAFRPGRPPQLAVLGCFLTFLGPDPPWLGLARPLLRVLCVDGLAPEATGRWETPGMYSAKDTKKTKDAATANRRRKRRKRRLRHSMLEYGICVEPLPKR